MTSENTEIDLRHGDCLELMRAMPDNSVDSVVTDPPYGLSFMGKAWDKGVPSCEVWKEALRVLKPGGHLLAFAGTRTQHRMACAIEDAGFEIRDMIAWVYGSGFPKSLDVSKAIDKAAGAEREVVGKNQYASRRPSEAESTAGCYGDGIRSPNTTNITAPATEAAKQWQGFGTALKPAIEPITVARKPLAKGNTVAKNVLEWGTGAINVDGCRVETNGETPKGSGNAGGNVPAGVAGRKDGNGGNETSPLGRWPANLIHDGSQEVLDLFPVTSDNSAARFFKACEQEDVCHLCLTPKHDPEREIPYRFKYSPKASKRDRDEGCEGMEEKQVFGDDGGTYQGLSNSNKPSRNHHPTVKPTDLMRYLCRLVTPPNGTILDPFMGSGSTGKAAVLEGFNFIGCELDAEYIEIAKARIGAVV